MLAVDTNQEEALSKLEVVLGKVEIVNEKDRKRVIGLIKLLKEWIKKPLSGVRKAIIIDTINELVALFPPPEPKELSNHPRLHLHRIMEVLTK